MSNSSGLKKREFALVWAFLTIFMVLALLGVIAALNFTKLSEGTCGSFGGHWEKRDGILVCYLDEGER